MKKKPFTPSYGNPKPFKITIFTVKDEYEGTIETT